MLNQSQIETLVINSLFIQSKLPLFSDLREPQISNSGYYNYCLYRYKFLFQVGQSNLNYKLALNFDLHFVLYSCNAVLKILQD